MWLHIRVAGKWTRRLREIGEKLSIEQNLTTPGSNPITSRRTALRLRKGRLLSDQVMLTNDGNNNSQEDIAIKLNNIEFTKNNETDNQESSINEISDSDASCTGEKGYTNRSMTLAEQYTRPTGATNSLAIPRPSPLHSPRANKKKRKKKKTFTRRAQRSQNFNHIKKGSIKSIELNNDTLFEVRSI